jgi:hypothetical protein
MIEFLFISLIGMPISDAPAPPKLPPLPENIVGLPAKETELEDAEDQDVSGMLKFKLSKGYVEETGKSTPLPKADKSKKSIIRRGKRNK